MENQELIKKTNEITDKLEHEAMKKLNEAQAYYKGYAQACEDFGRAIRLEVYDQNQSSRENKIHGADFENSLQN